MTDVGVTDLNLHFEILLLSVFQAIFSNVLKKYGVFANVWSNYGAKR